MHPQGPYETEIWTYFFVDKDAPPEVRAALTHYYEHWYGPGGMTQKDDMENWYNLTIASKGPMARKLPLNYQLGPEPPLHGPSEFGLPGLFANSYSDENHRRFYQRWAEVMEPLSRFSHFVSNVQLLNSDATQVGPSEIRVKCRFMVYRNRYDDEESTFVGKRIDTLRRVDGNWSRWQLVDGNWSMATGRSRAGRSTWTRAYCSQRTSPASSSAVSGDPQDAV